ncbi:hypothetical protein B9Z19DRAFT_1127598 [Tuber borchii]|uniref:Uncharacterized protein n=1 Tax=Tuber borchii TaxID=42251 RepID=A0A2T6ZQZ5_TUBBO|nr:hypothetical protein B9Z19DRAFT_1127598 [Tuber borchii]
MPPSPGGDSYRPRSPFTPHPTWDSYRSDSSRFANSRAATNQPVTSRAEDPVSSWDRSPFHRCCQGTSDEPGVGRVTKKPLPDRRDRNSIPSSQRFRDGNNRSSLHAGKGIIIEVRNGPPGSSRACNPPESSLTHTRDFSKFSLTIDSPRLLAESQNLGQPTKEFSWLGENNSVTSSARSQPDTNVPHPRGREGSPEDTSYSSGSRFLVAIAFAAREKGASKPDSAPNTDPSDSTWRTTIFTRSIWELVHGRAQQAKNCPTAALLPQNVPLFGSKISASRPGHLRSRKAKFKGSLEEYYQMLSDKEKKEHDDNPTFPTGSREDGGPTFSSSSEGEDYNQTSLKNPGCLDRASPGLSLSSVLNDSTNNTRPIEAKKDSALSKAQQEDPPKSEAQAASENAHLTKDTLRAGSVPNRSTHSIAPTRKLVIARGKQLRPELVQAMALLRASTSQSVHPEHECGKGHLPLASEGTPVTTLEISSCTSEKDGIPEPPNR